MGGAQCGARLGQDPITMAAKSFRAYDDFTAAHSAAKAAACAALGPRWSLAPRASVLGRVPAAWVACKVFGRVSKSPRDMRMPAACYWPGGALPVGPVYSADYARETAPLGCPMARLRAEHRGIIAYARQWQSAWESGLLRRQLHASLANAAAKRRELAEHKRLAAMAAEMRLAA
jgi:hypothetical protein